MEGTLVLKRRFANMAAEWARASSSGSCLRRSGVGGLLGFLGSVETEMGRVVGCNVSPAERRQLWRCVEEVVMSGNVNVGL